MRTQLIALFCVVLTGCTFGVRTCTSKDDCEQGSTCSEGGFCVAGETPTGGGSATGGGAATGGGTGTGGGTTTGGGDGTGGGSSACLGVNCAQFEECVDDGGTGQCVLADFVVEWVTPDAGSHFSGATPISASVRVRRADQSIYAIDSLPVTDAAGLFSYSSGIWTGRLQMSSGAAEGAYQFTAGWPDAGRSATLTLMKDNTPPTVDLYVFDRPSTAADPDLMDAGFWKKDETAIVRVDVVDGARAATATDIRVGGGGAGVGVTPVSCPMAPTGCLGACACFGVDLASASLPAYRGTVSVEVGPIADDANNLSASVDGGIFVSRFKWVRQFDIPSSATELRPVAVTQDGRVISAAANAKGTLGASIIKVFAFDQSGNDAGVFTESLGVDASTAIELTAGPIVSNSYVTFGLLRTIGLGTSYNSILKPISLAEMSGASEPCSSNANAPYRGDMSLSVLADGGERFFAQRTGEVSAWSPNGCIGQTLSPTPNDTSLPFSMVAFSRDGGSSELFVTSEGGDPLWKLEYAGTSWTDRGSLALTAGTQPRGLFAVGTDYVGGGGGVSSTGFNFSVASASDFTTSPAVSYSPATNAGPPAVGNDYVVFGNNSSRLTKIGYVAGAWADAGTALTVDAGVGSLQSTTPVIGEGGFVYFSGNSGAVTIRHATDLSLAWDIPALAGNLTSAGSVSQPALDKYRPMDASDGCGKQLGVFYQLSKSSTSARLMATIVDSRGLERTAPWPKYQRDNANRGNPTLPVDVWSCP